MIMWKYFDAVVEQIMQLGLAGLELEEFIRDEETANIERELEPARLRTAELRLKIAEPDGPDEL